MAQPVIAAVAVINNKNFPLYIRCFIEDESTVQFSFYAALDRFTDKGVKLICSPAVHWF